MPDNSIYTMTPGSAVADTLQQILARKRQEAHDALMERMAQEEQTSRIADRTAQAELAKAAEARLSRGTDSDIALNLVQIANANENLFQSQVKNVRRGGKPKDEALLQKMRERDMMEETPMFGPPSDLQPEGSKFEGYVGTPEEQQREQLLSYFDNAIAESGDDKDKVIGLNIMKAGGPAIPFYFSPQDTTLVDPDNLSKPTVLKGVRREGVLAVSRRPQVPAGYQPQPYQVLDENGNFIGNTSVPDEAVSAWNAKNPGKRLVSMDWKPGANAAGKISTADISILASTYQAYQDAQRNYDNSYGDFGRDLTGQAKAKKNVYDRVVSGVAAKAGISPNSLDAANFINDDPELKGLPLTAVMEHPKFKQTFDTSTMDTEDMADLNKAFLLFKEP